MTGRCSSLEIQILAGGTAPGPVKRFTHGCRMLWRLGVIFQCLESRLYLSLSVDLRINRLLREVMGVMGTPLGWPFEF